LMVGKQKSFYKSASGSTVRHAERRWCDE
jgi:hypothetical protein